MPIIAARRVVPTGRDTVATMPIPRRYTTDAIVLVAVRSRRGRPRPDPHHPDRRQAQGDRQGRPPPDVAARWQPRAVRRAAPSRWPAAGRSTSSPRSASATPGCNLRDSLESAATAWYLAELADRSLEERHAAEPLYTLLRRAYELLDAGDGARPGGALVRDAPRSTSSAAARGRPLRRMRPGARGGRARSAGCRRSAASCASAVPVRRHDRAGDLARGAQAAQGLPAPRHRGHRRRSAWRRPSSARSKPRCATSCASRSSGMPRSLAFLDEVRTAHRPAA